MTALKWGIGALVGISAAFAQTDDGRQSLIRELNRLGLSQLRQRAQHSPPSAEDLRSKLKQLIGPLPEGAVRSLLVGDAAAEIPKLLSAARDVLANVTALTAADSSLGQSLKNVEGVTEKLN